MFALNARTGIARLTLNSPPVNSLTPLLMGELTGTLREKVHGRDAVRALVLHSDLSIFSAGLDLKSLLIPPATKASFSALLKQLVCLAQAFLKCDVPVVAALNGHAFAGGCVLALCADKRVASDRVTIGLNEVAVGMSPPEWVHALLARQVGEKFATDLLLEGKMLQAQDAEKCRLVDAVVSPELVEQKADSIAQEMLKAPVKTRKMTKSLLNRRLIELMDDPASAEHVWTSIQGEELQKNVKAFVEKKR